MNILVFGGNGFLGLEIEKEMINSNHTFFSASRNAVSGYKVDISNFEGFNKLPNDFFDVVINCATILPGGSLLDNDYLNAIYNTNILGTQNICRWVSTQNTIKKIINCSTLVVVNKPWDYNLKEDAATYPKGDHVLYCSSKLMQELIVDTFATKNDIDFVNVRFSAIYGESMPKSGILWALYQQAMTNKCIKIVNGNKVSFDFINVTDAAEVLVTSIDSDKSRGILNAASGIETSLLELATIIRSNCSEEVTIENEDQNDFVSNRSKINVEKLNQIINTDSFISLNEGINQIFKLW
jgi:UDP-glucose 4-epimerase